MERKWWTLITVNVATFMLLLDITIVNVALPSIQDDLNSSFTNLQWVVDAYALMLASATLTAGSLADRLGRRRVFAAGIVIFTVASLLCAIAPSATALNFARGLQGIGGASMFATALALIAQEFHGPELGKAMGAWGATIGGAVAIGPLVGGALTDSLGWESIFYLNVPIGIGCVWLTFNRISESRDPSASRPDWPGLLTFSGSLFMLVFALLRGNDEGWGSTLVVSLLIGAVVLMTIFVAYELRARSPMLDLSLFRRAAFGGAQLGAFALSASMFAMFLYLTLYLQNVLGLEPLAAGARFLPLTIVSMCAAFTAGQLLGRLGPRWLIATGLLLVSGGLLLMSGIDDGDSWTTLLAGFIVAGLGVGLTNPSLAASAVAVVPREKSGMGSGINNTFRQVGISTGIAGLGAVFQGRISTKVVDGLAGTPVGAGGRAHQIADAVSTGGPRAALHGLAPAQAAQVGQVARHAFIGAFNEILLIGAVVALIGSLGAAVLLRGFRLHVAAAPVAEAALSPE